MSAFTENEIEYPRDQGQRRPSTVDAKGWPHVVPVAFRYDAQEETIDIGGHDLADELIRIVPERIVGPIDSDAYEPNARRVGR